jgi:hypothetical protein
VCAVVVGDHARPAATRVGGHESFNDSGLQAMFIARADAETPFCNASRRKVHVFASSFSPRAYVATTAAGNREPGERQILYAAVGNTSTRKQIGDRR